MCPEDAVAPLFHYFRDILSELSDKHNFRTNGQTRTNLNTPLKCGYKIANTFPEESPSFQATNELEVIFYNLVFDIVRMTGSLLVY